MPTMANITVLNAAGANVVYTAAVPSAGDKTPAKWTAIASNAVAGFRSMFTAGTKDNGSQNARIFNFNGAVPIVATVNGVQVQLAKMTCRCEYTLPSNVDSALVYDGFVQLSNAQVSTLIREVANTGYAPT